MKPTANILTFLAAAAIVAPSVTCQRLATYDPAAPLELATSSCGSALSHVSRQNLWARTPSSQDLAGAVAADNVHRRLFTTTGYPADGIDAVPFLAIGSGATPTNYAAPPGFNQITAMMLDPIDPSGNSLIVSDGFSIAPYDYSAGAFIIAPKPVPVPAGRVVTGLDYDVWTNDLLVVCDDATILRNPIGGGPWTTIAPAVAVPALATGIAVCRSAASSPMVSFFDGTVMDPQTGAVKAFPGAPLSSSGVRHHRGMTFFARPMFLGGRGATLAPSISVQGSYQAGSMDCRIETENAQGPVLIAVDIAPTMVPFPQLPMIDGAVLINPATSVMGLFSPGLRYLPLDLTEAPVSASLVAQAATLGSGVFHMSDAVYFQTWL